MIPRSGFEHPTCCMLADWPQRDLIMKQLALIAALLSTLFLYIGCTDNLPETTTSADTKLPVERNALGETTILAESGKPLAQLKLANAYAQGAGVQQDFTEATRWFSKAAKQGNAEAQYYLGVIHAGGFVAPADRVEGYVWFCLAAKSGFKAATEDCKSLANDLSSEELVAAKTREAELSEEIQLQISK